MFPTAIFQGRYGVPTDVAHASRTIRSSCCGGAERGAEQSETDVIQTEREIATMSDTMTSVGTRLSMPAFPTLDGMDVDLQTLRGNKVLLFMWASW
jgi:hypothetical protein